MSSSFAHPAWLRRTMLLLWRSRCVLENPLYPLTDLAIRLWIAQAFIVSGVLKISDWDTALTLATYEYPVLWMAPGTAALLGVVIELAGGLLLALGLATRAVALAMLILAVVIQVEYQALDINLFWAVLLGWQVVRGAGPLSLDHQLAHGLADSALPFAGTLSRRLAALTRYGSALYQCMLRLWLALALAAPLQSLVERDSLTLWLPWQSATVMLPVAALTLVTLLVSGLLVRPAALLLLLSGLVTAHPQPYWLLACALLLCVGAGTISLDAWLGRWLRATFPQFSGKPAFSLDGLPHVVVVGAGFGGMACVAGLRDAPVRVTLVDKHNYHLFQPLLYQVATTTLSPVDIAMPVRALFRNNFNVRVLLGTVDGVDKVRRQISVDGKPLSFDYLVLATGASHSYFGKDIWAPYAPGLKRVEDATEVRRRLLLAFEHAESTDDDSERQRLLTFLIVGGGPTGVELAGAIAELARFGLEKEFRRFDPASARVILVQSAPRLLPTFAQALSAQAKTALEKLGVEVRLNQRVENIDAAGADIGGMRIPAATVLWAAGVVASPAGRWLGVETDNAGRLKVGTDLSVPGHAEIFAIGDTAASNAWAGSPVPGLAPAAKQGGAYVARVLRARVGNRNPPAPFVYRHLGSLATIGRKSAVADFGRLRVSGALAWWLWGLVHVYFLAGLRNRVSVMFDWMWAYLTFSSAARIITDSEPTRQP